VRRALIGLVVALDASCLVVATPPAWADASGDLDKAFSAYVAHRYEDAETRLRALLDPKTGSLRDPDVVADARMLLGAVLIAEARRDEAEHVFERLLIDKPSYAPDPLRVSAEAMYAFIDARSRSREMIEKAEAEARAKAEAERARVEAEKRNEDARRAALEKLCSQEVIVARHSRYIGLLPFGIGQFQNGQNALGALFLTTEVLLAAGTIVSSAIESYNVAHMYSEFSTGDTHGAGEYLRRAQAASQVGVGLAAAFGLVAIGGIAHAELTFVPQRVEIRKRAIVPLSLAPTLGPGTVGVRGSF
jgi:hypothetical protein